MLAFRLDKSVRVACGLALLLLLVAQEKVCPWLANPSRERDQHQTDRGNEKRKSKKSSDQTLLPYIVPDASAPRWSATWNHTALRTAGGARDGVVSRGRNNPFQTDSRSVCHVNPTDHAWHCFLSAADSELPVGLPAETPLVVDPAVRNTIWPVGPPISQPRFG